MDSSLDWAIYDKLRKFIISIPSRHLSRIVAEKIKVGN